MKKRSDKKNPGYIFFICSIVFTFLYYISTSGKIALVDLFTTVFLPCLALAINKAESKIKYFENYKFKNIEDVDFEKLNYNSEKKKEIQTIDIQINDYIEIDIVSKRGTALILKIGAIMSILIYFIILYIFEQTQISYLVGLTGTSIIISNLILSTEKSKDLKFKYIELPEQIDKITRLVNEAFATYRLKAILYNSIEIFNDRLYFILVYVDIKRKLRFAYSIFMLTILVSLLRSMCVFGSDYIISIIPTILTYYILFSESRKKEYNAFFEMKSISILPYNKNDKLNDTFEKIKKITVKNSLYYVLYFQNDYIKLLKNVINIMYMRVKTRN